MREQIWTYCAVCNKKTWADFITPLCPEHNNDQNSKKYKVTGGDL